MSQTKTVAGAVHDAIDNVATTVEEIHRSVADIPLDILGGIAPLRDTVEEVRRVQSRSITAVYDLVREVNDRVRDLTT
jgi:uncharacterized protein with von Willebrand factor type A (vWA) domain